MGTGFVNLSGGLGLFAGLKEGGFSFYLTLQGLVGLQGIFAV